LAQDHDWSHEGARAIIDLANNYGSFMLKNALALSIVLGKEDGDLGYRVSFPCQQLMHVP